MPSIWRRRRERKRGYVHSLSLDWASSFEYSLGSDGKAYNSGRRRCIPRLFRFLPLLQNLPCALHSRICIEMPRAHSEVSHLKLLQCKYIFWKLGAQRTAARPCFASLASAMQCYVCRICISGFVPWLPDGYNQILILYWIL